ncbi:MAG: hypothetical protein ACON4Q_05370 [Candidatus Puniceispirillaceae bacterium]
MAVAMAVVDLTISVFSAMLALRFFAEFQLIPDEGVAGFAFFGRGL